MMNLLESLDWRYAVKQFDETKRISNDDLHKLKKALRLSPSSYGLQPWHFLVIENEEVKQKLRAVSWNQGQITQCSHLVVFCYKTNFNTDSVDDFIESVASIRNISKESMNDYANMIKGFLKDSYDDILSLKEKGLGTVVICPIGYRSKDDRFSTMEKVRFPLDKIFTEI